LTGEQPPLIVLLGPTAIGKTSLALKLAQALDGEIIGADSRQVYLHMDIGTAKPTSADRDTVPHHLINFLDPADQLTLARYQEMTYATVDDIHARGKVPLLVGGTGQYLTAVIEGWSIPGVPPNDALRAELEAYADLHGKDALYERLQRIDPDAAVKIHPNNVRRVVRALEVCIEAGERISVLQRKKPPPYRILELGLRYERQLLYDRADKRVDQMMARGFLAEVQALLDMGYDRNLPSMSGLGYVQLVRHLLDQMSLADAVEDTKIATHQYIRRQLTWFRGHNPDVVWHNIETLDEQAIINDCKRWLQGEQA